ncbi:MAG: hypothetical protein CM15mV98_310 [uncultured marine virus]|nr:MAG: hypothetical protein CM15mV98_310 [uncultured marine virus]
MTKRGKLLKKIFLWKKRKKKMEKNKTVKKWERKKPSAFGNAKKNWDKNKT